MLSLNLETFCDITTSLEASHGPIFKLYMGGVKT